MDNRDFPTPEAITQAIHTLISAFPGKYSAMAQQLDPVSGTDNALRNRVRQIGGQMAPLGMLLAMENIAKSHAITSAICKQQGGLFIKLPEIEIANEELFFKFKTLVSELGEFCHKHSQFTMDGELDGDEYRELDKSAHRIQTIVSEIVHVTQLIFGTEQVY